MATRLPGVLPSRDNLPQMPSARTGRPVARLEMDAVTAEGRGISAIGQGLNTLATSLQQTQDDNESLEVQRRLLEFEQAQSRALDDSRRTLTGDPTGFADRTRGSLTEAGRSLFAEAQESGLSPRALTRLAHGLSGLRDRVHTQAYSHELNQRGSHGERWATERIDALTQDYLGAPDDAARQRILADAERTIRLGRTTYGFSSEVEERLRAASRRMLEHDALARPDSYAALLELREGDPRARTPSTGQLSDLGLSSLRRQLERQGVTTPGETPEQAQRRLRTEGARVSRWISENFTGEDGQPLSLTQLQHDALVGFALSRRGRTGAAPEDALAELVPAIRTGHWESVAAAMRAGSLTEMEQPAPSSSTSTPGTPSVTPSPGTGSVEILPVPDGRTPVGVSPRSDAITGLVLHHTAGTTLSSALAQNRIARTGYHYYVDRDGRVYQFTPDNQTIGHVQPPGHSSRRPGQSPHLSSGNTIAISVVAPNNEDMTPEQRESVLRLTRQLATRYGIAPGDIVGHSEIQTSAVNEGAIAREIREGWTSTAPPSTTSGSADTTGRGELADMVLGQAPASRYAGLPADRRRAIIHSLTESVRAEMRTEIDDDIERIRRTGAPRTLPDGTTWLQRATRARVLTPMQASQYERRIREAQATFRAISGLSDMTPDEMARRQEEFDPSTADDRGDGDALATRVSRTLRRARERIADLRRTDPSLWASGTFVLGEPGAVRTGADGALHTVPAQDDMRVQPAREVLDAYRLLARRYQHLGLQVGEDGELTIASSGPGQERPQRFLLTDPRLTPDDRRLLIEARLAAMARVGIQTDSRHILTQAEAASILDLPTNLSGMDADTFSRRLREASRRATQLFGPRYARAAFDAAVHFRRITGDDRRREVTSTVDDLNAARRRGLAALDREEALWGTGVPPVGGGVGFGGVGSPPPPGAVGLGTAMHLPGVGPLRGLGMTDETPVAPLILGTRVPPNVSLSPPSGAPRPTPEQIAELAANPRTRQSTFDRIFGPGAAAYYLQRQQQGQ
jgi:hypothetical protein